MALRRLCVVGALLLGAGSARAQEGFSPRYAALVDHYARGDRAAALRDAGTWSEAALRLEVVGARALKERAACQDCPAARLWQETPVDAAVMLHTDRNQIDRTLGRTPGPDLLVAEALAVLLVDDPRRRDFARRWYVATCALALAYDGFDRGAEWANRGLRAFPADPDLSLALAAIEEGLGAQPVEGAVGDPGRWAENQRLDHLRRAVKLLNEVLAARPASEEARLRLGRVSWRLKRPREAQAALAWILEHESSRAALYLAHLFRGRLHEDAGRGREAAASYRAAAELLPQSQAAHLALSHVLHASGDSAESRRLVEAALSAGGRRSAEDPFWIYPWGPAARLVSLLQELRREVTW